MKALEQASACEREREIEIEIEIECTYVCSYVCGNGGGVGCT